LSGLEGDEESSHLLLDNLATNLQVFSDKRKIYHQVRFLNTDGMEIVRINYDGSGATIAANDKLQNKKGRYYFDDVINLKKGELMISPLDLNREKGKIESPLRPTIRYATPVFNEANELQGIIVLNILAKKFLDIIGRENMPNETMMFVNKAGDYYQHPDDKKSWGSKRDLNTGENLFKDKPSVQKSIVALRKAGNFETEDEIASYTPILLNNARHHLGTIINFVPKKVVFSPIYLFLWVFLGIVLFALLVALLLATILSSSISSPLVMLKDEVERLAKGDLDSSIDIETNDEIGELSHAIEKLRRSMQILMKRASR
jgi:methyl-accepting chemotaxis protein